LAIELKSIKDHLLPTKDLAIWPICERQAALPSSPSRRVSATRCLHYNRTVRVSYTRITRNLSRLNTDAARSREVRRKSREPGAPRITSPNQIEALQSLMLTQEFRILTSGLRPPHPHHHEPKTTAKTGHSARLHEGGHGRAGASSRPGNRDGDEGPTCQATG